MDSLSQAYKDQVQREHEIVLKKIERGNPAEGKFETLNVGQSTYTVYQDYGTGKAYLVEEFGDPKTGFELKFTEIKEDQRQQMQRGEDTSKIIDDAPDDQKNDPDKKAQRLPGPAPKFGGSTAFGGKAGGMPTVTGDGVNFGEAVGTFVDFIKNQEPTGLGGVGFGKGLR